MRRVLTVLIAVSAVAALGWWSWPAEHVEPGPYDVERQPMPLIPPGTVIGEGPPEGWSHLIVKSHPEPGSGDVQRIPSLAMPLTRLLFTANLARVETQRRGRKTQHVLAEVAIGVGTNVAGKDTIISPDTQADLGAGFGFFARYVLTHAYAKLKQGTQVARSDTMVLYDAPSLMARGGRHQDVVFRNAVLVDAGRLDVLVWCIALDEQRRYAFVEGEIERFGENLVERPGLHVDGAEFNALGLPSDRAFALPSVPPGEEHFAVPAELKEWCESPTLSAADAARLESGLRELLRKGKL